MKQLFKSLRAHFIYYLIGITVCVSIIATLYFYSHGNQNVSDYDAIARLNIARKMVDSITPGIGQLGGIWLPFPQILILLFVWNDFLWHSGFAGAIVSGIAFIIAAVFIQKTAFLITKSFITSLFIWFLFVTNVNILLLQSMAMSESFFLCCLILIVYFLTKWTENYDMISFLSAAGFIAIITLTRYEGYFVFIGSLITVSLISFHAFWKRDGGKKVEGMILVFITVAGYGIFLWCLYCALFYKDPLYWLHLYSASKGQISTASQSVETLKTTAENVDRKTVFESLTTYSGAIFWTNGILTVLLSIAGFFIFLLSMIQKTVKKEAIRQYIPLMVVSLILFIFLIYGYEKGFIPDIEYPPLTLHSMLHKSFNEYAHSNIRYGIIMAPLLLLFIGFAIASDWIGGFLIIILLCFQLFTTFTTPFFLQFSFPASWGYSLIKPIPWFQSHYDTGLILISANRHENFMFQTGLPYKDFIYEGSRQYWTTSLNNPSKYSTWVVYENSKGDTVNDYLTDNAYKILKKDYRLAYTDNNFKIYRLMTK